MLSLASDPVAPSSNAASRYLPLTAAKKPSLLLRTSLIPLRPPGSSRKNLTSSRSFSLFVKSAVPWDVTL